MIPTLRLMLALVLTAFAGSAAAVEPKAQVLVAVAANFNSTINELEPIFEARTGADLRVTSGATGGLYAQIKAGAPFDVLLAADQQRPARLETEGVAVDGSRFTYAVGRLALWSADPAAIGQDGVAAMTAPHTRFIAMANPELAPYGAAAAQALRGLGIEAEVQEKLVLGQNAGQAFSLVATGNAEMGLVALSSVLGLDPRAAGSRWDIPQTLYAPIRQDAVLLSADNAAATAFLDFLRGDVARAIIERHGYGTE